MRSCIRPMHGALKGLRIRPVIRDAKVKSVSTIEVEAVYTEPGHKLGIYADAFFRLASRSSSPAAGRWRRTPRFANRKNAGHKFQVYDRVRYTINGSKDGWGPRCRSGHRRETFPV